MTTKTIQPEYEALGIHPDTMACVAILPKDEAKEYVWALATHGVAAEARKAPEGKEWHVAVRGALAYNPAAYFASIRGDGDAKTCTSTARMQHPQEGEGR